MRSYQYYAANAISDKVAKTNWQQLGSANNPDRLGVMCGILPVREKP